MTAACHDVEQLISLRAARALDPAEAARLDAHLAGCDACRDELAATEALLADVRLPPPGEAMAGTPAGHQWERVLAGLPEAMLRELRGRERRTVRVQKLAVGMGLAAALALAVAAPVLFRHTPRLSPEELAATAPAWQEPDVDALWEDTQVLEYEASSEGASRAVDARTNGNTAGNADALLAAYDAGVGN